MGRLDGQSGTGHRQQELLVVVAAPVAAAQGQRDRVRRSARAAVPTSQQGRDPGACACRTCAVRKSPDSPRRRDHRVGFAGHLRVRGRTLAFDSRLARRSGAARARARDQRRDALRVRHAAQRNADELPAHARAGHARAAAPGRDRPRHRHLDELSGNRAIRCVPVRRRSASPMRCMRRSCCASRSIRCRCRPLRRHMPPRSSRCQRCRNGSQDARNETEVLEKFER